MTTVFTKEGTRYQLIVSPSSFQRKDPVIKPDKTIISKNAERYIPKRDDEWE